MAKPVTDEERQRIIEAFPSGKSCRQIAADFNRATTTISTIAKSVGHEFGQVNTVRAREIKAVYDEERRQQIRLNTVDAAEKVLQQIFEPATIFNFGGRDNTYNEHKLDKPPYRDQRDIAQTFKTLMSIVLEIDKREQGTSDYGLLDVLFGQIQSEANEYSDAHD